MFVVDTNVLVYAANRDAPEHSACRERLERWRASAGAWYLTWGICYEFLRVTTHPRVFPRPLVVGEAWEFLESVLSSSGASFLVPAERHVDVLSELLDEMPELGGNLLHDAATVVLMREHGIHRIYTRNMDFHRFPGIEPLDPLDPLSDSG